MLSAAPANQVVTDELVHSSLHLATQGPAEWSLKP
jgi:hypothetical protein